jgi:hypothetical protein
MVDVLGVQAVAIQLLAASLDGESLLLEVEVAAGNSHELGLEALRTGLVIRELH